MKILMRRFFSEEIGVTAIEYGLIAGLIAIVVVSGMSLLGTSLSGLFSWLGSTVSSAVS